MLIVAHRLGILGVVDKILVLRDGRIEAFAGRDEVLAKLQDSAQQATEKPGLVPALRAVRGGAKP